MMRTFREGHKVRRNNDRHNGEALTAGPCAPTTRVWLYYGAAAIVGRKSSRMVEPTTSVGVQLGTIPS